MDSTKHSPDGTRKQMSSYVGTSGSPAPAAPMVAAAAAISATSDSPARRFAPALPSPTT